MHSNPYGGWRGWLLPDNYEVAYVRKKIKPVSLVSHQEYTREDVRKFFIHFGGSEKIWPIKSNVICMEYHAYNAGAAENLQCSHYYTLR